jgi:hypothetical protein
MIITDLVGKTIDSIESVYSDRLSRMTVLWIKFTDGSQLEVIGAGCDEGGWLEIDLR